MTDEKKVTNPEPKTLPSNLSDLKKTDTFKEVWDKHTIPDLIAILDDIGVHHASTDDKAALVWRMMDGKNIAFAKNPSPTDIEKNEAAKELDQSATKEPTTDVEPLAGTNAPEDAVMPETGDNNQSGVDLEAANDPLAGTNTPEDTVTPEADPDADLSYAGFLQQALHQNTIKVTIQNNSPYDVFEPITRTRMIARQETVMRVSPSQERGVKSNLRQINRNRGNILDIEFEAQ